MLKRIAELPADLETDSPTSPVQFPQKLRLWTYFLVRHLAYAYAFLAVRTRAAGQTSGAACAVHLETVASVQEAGFGLLLPPLCGFGAAR